MLKNHLDQSVKSDLSLVSESRFSVGIDVGGTKIAGLLLDGNNEIVTRATLPVPKSSTESLLDGLARVALELIDAAPAEHRERCSVGFAIAGWLNAASDFVRFSPHLPLTGVFVQRELESRVGRPVVIANDADAAGWAEFRLGAALDYDDAVCLTLGTGLGSAVIANGTLIRGAIGMAGELGHVCIDPTGPECACGGIGCLEIFASGTGAERAARKAGLMMTGRELVAAAELGDLDAHAVLDDVARPLAQALTMVVGTLDPGVVVIGGGFGTASPYFLDSLRRQYAALASRPESRPLVPVEVATWGPEAGAVGAALLAAHHKS